MALHIQSTFLAPGVISAVGTSIHRRYDALPSLILDMIAPLFSVTQVKFNSSREDMDERYQAKINMIGDVCCHSISISSYSKKLPGANFTFFHSS